MAKHLHRVALPAEILFDVPAPDGAPEDEIIALAAEALARVVDAEEGFNLGALKGGRVYHGLQDTMGWSSSAEDWKVVDTYEEECTDDE